jgi:UDP-2,3-diacylglucosamine pyrophosphatase LpxH
MELPENAEIVPPGVHAGGPFEEVNVVVSDMHLSAGKTLTVRAAHTFRYKVVRLVRKLRGHAAPPDVVEVPNPLEDFPYDDVFAAFVEHLVRRFAGVDLLRLRLMGDVFDPLAVTWKGRLVDPPFETVAVRKMRAVIAGHPQFFDALAWFVRQSNARLDLFVGNHDQFLSWQRVQREIVRRIAGDDAEAAARIRFVDQSMDFEETSRGVLYYHGMNAEAHCHIDPKTTVLTEIFGKRMKRPVLNQPLGSHMTVELASRIKLYNELVGRAHDPVVWVDAIKRRWSWAAYAALMLAWFLYNQLFSTFDHRRRTKLITILEVILSMFRKNPVDGYAAKLLKQREGIRAVVLGHSHHWRRITGPEGTYLNTGTWAHTVKLVWPTFDLRWKRFRWVELAWRTLLHFLRTGELRFARQMTKLLGFVAGIAAACTYLMMSFTKNGFGDLSPTLTDLKLPVGILLVFFVIKGLFGIFAVKPEVVEATRFTFALVTHGRDGGLTADLMEYVPAEDTVRECV